MDNHQIFGGELEISHESRHRLAAQIHIGGGLRQDDALCSHPSLAPERPVAVPVEGNSPEFRQVRRYL